MALTEVERNCVLNEAMKSPFSSSFLLLFKQDTKRHSDGANLVSAFSPATQRQRTHTVVAPQSMCHIQFCQLGNQEIQEELDY